MILPSNPGKGTSLTFKVGSVSLGKVLMEFFKCVLEDRFDEAEQIAVKALKKTEVKRDELVYAVGEMGSSIFNLEKHDELAMTVKATACFMICYKINRRKSLKKSISNLLATAFCNSGKALSDAGKLKDSEECYKTALEFNSRDAFAYDGLGRTLSNMRRQKDAEEAFRKAVKISPKSAPFLTNLGVALYREKKMTEAERVYRRAIGIDSRCFKAHFNLGAMLDHSGKLKEAEECYRTTLEIDPEYPYAQGQLGMLLFRTNRADDARQYLGLAQEKFLTENKEKETNVVKGCISWIDGFLSWRSNKIKEAENNYALASAFFLKGGDRKLSSTMSLITEYLHIDEEYVGYIDRGELLTLKNGISSLSGKIDKGLRRKRDACLEGEILHARAACIKALSNALMFGRIEQDKLEKARNIFLKHGFLEAKVGVNALDTFITELVRFKDISQIPKQKEAELFLKLKPAAMLDGKTTAQYEKLVMGSVRVEELNKDITQPVLRALEDTKKELRAQVEELKKAVDVVDRKTSEILAEISVKKVAYGEYEVVFPMPLGVFRLHIPAGEISAQNLAEIKSEITEKVDQQ
jgi:tetratricopeptide (TPR) repeat protein